MSTSASNDIRELFLQSALESVDSVISSSEEAGVPSEGFEKKMRKIFRETNKKKSARILNVLPVLPMKKWIAISLVAALLLSLVGCVWAHSEEIYEFLQVVFEKGKLPDEKSLIKTFFDCTYIPEEYSYDAKGSDGWDQYTQTRSIWRYWRNGYSFIRFNQRIHDPNVVSHPSQGSEVWYETIGGTERLFWILREDGAASDGSLAYSGSMGCFWTDGYCDYEVRFYRFYGSDEITVDELRMIVECVLPVYSLPTTDE